MPAYELALNIITVVAYLAATVLLFKRTQLEKSALAGADLQGVRVVAGMAIAAHSALLVLNLFTAGGLSLNFFTTLSLFAWQAVIVFGLASLRVRIENLGLVLFPLAALAQAIDAVVVSSSTALAVSAGLQFHILCSILSLGLLTVAAAQAVLISIQHRRLRARRLEGLHTLPPLETMETLFFQLLVVGWVVLSLSLLSGIPHVHDIFAQQLVHKTTLTVVAWLVFSILLIGHYRLGWRGKTALRATWLGYGLVLLAYFGSRVVVEFLL